MEQVAKTFSTTCFSDSSPFFGLPVRGATFTKTTAIGSLLPAQYKHGKTLEKRRQFVPRKKMKLFVSLKKNQTMIQKT